MSGARPDTWMPWYIGDFLRKTMHLDADEDGAYRRLIDATWVRGGELKASDKEKAIICKLPLKKWLAIKGTIAEFFEIDQDGTWHHGRVSEELAKAIAIVSARSAGAKRTNERRWGDGSAGRSEVAERIAERPASDTVGVSQSGRPSPSPSPSPIEDASASSAENAGKQHGKKRGTRLAADWQPSAEDQQFARSQGLDPSTVAAEFRDYWVALPGADATKLDWSATFRNRCRQLAERAALQRARANGAARSAPAAPDYTAPIRQHRTPKTPPPTG